MCNSSRKKALIRENTKSNILCNGQKFQFPKEMFCRNIENLFRETGGSILGMSLLQESSPKTDPLSQWNFSAKPPTRISKNQTIVSSRELWARAVLARSKQRSKF